MAAPQPPPRAARPQTTSPAARETRDTESFRARLFAKGRSQVLVPPCARVAGAVPRLAATTEGPGPDGPPKGSEVSSTGARGLQIPRAKDSSLHPNLTAKGGREACPPLPPRAWGSWVCYIHFLIGERGRTDSLWRILIPSNLDSECPKGPPGVHRPTQRRFPDWGDKWKQQFPFLHPLQPPVLGGDSVPPGSPAARSGLAGQEAAAGDAAPQGRGQGAGGRERARPGPARRLPRPR